MLKGKITRHEAGEFVTSGIYLNRKSLDLTAIGEEGGTLPAENDAHYYKLPLLLVMALAHWPALSSSSSSPWQFPSQSSTRSPAP